MLEYIRSSAQSFGVKVAFGVIILVFVFWGVGNFNDRDYSNVVAVVNGEPIVAQEFEKAYQGAEEYILRNNPGITREQLIKDHLGRQVLRDMIQTLLMQQEARRAGIAVTPVELRLAVGKMQAFQDENGRFDPEAYKRVLGLRRVSPAQYEKELADQILQEKMFSLLTAPTWVDPAEALNRYNYLRERRIVDYVFLPAAYFAEEIKVTEPEIQAWYDSHQEEFAIPARVDVEWLALGPESLADPKSISEAAARAWYEANLAKFQIPEQVNAAHILAPVPQEADPGSEKEAREKIDKAMARLEAGADFAEVAGEFNPEGAAGPGGELGWIGRGQTVPEFEEALFAAPVGKAVGPVRSPFGWHIILAREKREAGTKAFAEVEEEARKALAAEEGADKLHDALDNLIEDNILQKPLANSAARYGLQVERSGLVDAPALVQALGISPEGAQILLGLAPGQPLETALEAGDKYIIARVAANAPAAHKPLADVSAEIAAAIRSQKAIEQALADANSLLAKIRRQSLAEIRAEKIDLKESPPVERGGAIGDFGENAAVTEAVFATETGKWLDHAFQMEGPGGPGAFIARVAKTLPPEAGEFESVEKIMVDGARQARMEAIYALFIQNLADKAKIEITNQNLIDRAAMQ